MLNLHSVVILTFSALTLLVLQQEGHLPSGILSEHFRQVFF